MLLALIVLVVLMILFGSGISRAFQLSRRAAIFAGAEPYCLLTFDREGRTRPAVSTLDLSPLVMRVDGRYPVDRVPWLVVRDRYGAGGYRYVYGRRTFEISEQAGSLACEPPKP
ncbi:MAG: hypothetical protein ACT4OE_02065 [Sphingosinicella sp.]